MLYAVNSAYYINQNCLIVSLGLLTFVVVYTGYPIFILIKDHNLLKACFLYDACIQHLSEWVPNSWLGSTRHYNRALNKDIANNENKHNKISKNNHLLFHNKNEQCQWSCYCHYYHSSVFYSFSQSDFWKQMETWRFRAVLCLNALLCM